MASAAVIARYASTIHGAAATVVDDVFSQLSVGDVVEGYTLLPDRLSAGALLVVSEVDSIGFKAHLVAAGETDFEKALIDLQDPINFAVAEQAEDAGIDHGTVFLVALAIHGHVRYPVDWRMAWLRGARLKKARGVLQRIAEHLQPKTLDHPAPIWLHGSRFRFCLVVPWVVLVWLGWLMVCMFFLNGSAL